LCFSLSNGIISKQPADGYDFWIIQPKQLLAIGPDGFSSTVPKLEELPVTLLIAFELGFTAIVFFFFLPSY
jgi:hypothetical protein